MASMPPSDGRRLVLASTSPYRRELLARLGLPFVQDNPGIDEDRLPGEAPASMAQRLARAKAQAVAVRHPGAVVIGSDQLAACDADVLGKPGDSARACAQLERLSGRTVEFLTAVCVVDAGTAVERAALVRTQVRFRTLTRTEIETYVDRERPLDCAGSFKSEGLGIVLFDALTSEDPTALIGLPLIATARLLRELGMDPLRS